MPSCLHGGYSQRHQPQAVWTTTSAHGSFVPSGCCCPTPLHYSDPIRESRRLPLISQLHWFYSGSVPDDLVWAAVETVPTLRHSSFTTCRDPYAGGNDGCACPVPSPSSRPSPSEVGLGSLIMLSLAS